MISLFDHLAPVHLELLSAGGNAVLREDWTDEALVVKLCQKLALPCLCLRPDMADIESYEENSKLAHELRFLPLFHHDIVMVVACATPWDEGYAREVRKGLHMQVIFVGATPLAIDRALAAAKQRASVSKVVDESVKSPSVEPRIVAWDVDRGDYRETVKCIVRHAHSVGASDILLDPMDNRLDVRFRIHGTLEVMPPISLPHRNAITNTCKVMAGIAVEEAKGFRSGRTEVRLAEDHLLSLRVECQPTGHGDAFVMRLLDPMSIARFNGTLPFPGREAAIVRSCMEKVSGMILVTGPTGSGKTTTLYRCLTSLDLSSLNVRTIEDPIEYLIDRIIQTQVSHGASFATALRSMLRADPDVILVGEIRDEETAEVAVQATLTGHLIFSTLHTEDALGTISRLRDLKISPLLISQTLSMVAAQRLIPTLCPHCKVERKPTPRVERHFARYKMNLPSKVYGQGGCKHCKGTGWTGRRPLFEVLHVNETIRELIQRDALMVDIRKAWRADGGVTLAEAGMAFVADGTTSYEQIACYDPVIDS